MPMLPWFTQSFLSGLVGTQDNESAAPVAFQYTRSETASADNVCR
jgi:hypothetical protein